jgi:tetratricopeptide (TPR) repeat protein
MRRTAIRDLVILTVGALTASVLFAQVEPLRGVVVNPADHGVRDVRVVLRDPADGGTTFEATTDEDGAFSIAIDQLRPGLELYLHKDGYDDVTIPVTAQQLVVASFRVVMQASEVEKPTPTPSPIPSWIDDRLEQRERAVELYNEAVELYEEAEDNAEAKKAALRMMREAASLDPMFAEPLKAMIGVALKQQNWAEVSRLSEALLRIDPNDEDAVQNLYVSLIIVRHFERVGDAAKRLISIDPEKISYVEQHAKQFYENGIFRMARALYQALTEVAPDMANGYLNLGLCCASLGDVDCTRSSFETFLELAPEDHPDLENVRLELANLATGEGGE